MGIKGWICVDQILKELLMAEPYNDEACTHSGSNELGDGMGFIIECGRHPYCELGGTLTFCLNAAKSSPTVIETAIWGAS